MISHVHSNLPTCKNIVDIFSQPTSRKSNLVRRTTIALYAVMVMLFLYGSFLFPQRSRCVREWPFWPNVFMMHTSSMIIIMIQRIQFSASYVHTVLVMICLWWLFYDFVADWYESFAYSISGSWWRHQMETFSALLAICAGNSSVTGEFPP